LRAGVTTELTLRTRVGRHRELHFEGLPPEAAATALHVEIRRGDGVSMLVRDVAPEAADSRRRFVILLGRARSDVDPLLPAAPPDGSGRRCDCVLQLGDYVVEARLGERITHRSELHIDGNVDAPRYFEIPRMR
jgi:hypothetical protein